MKQIIVDANVVVKWFIDEIDSIKAKILRDKFVEGEIELLVPSLLYFEVLNALKYSKLFNQDELSDAGESLDNYGFIAVPIKKDIREQMIKVAVEHEISIYNASYLGITIVKEGILCTADEIIIKKLPMKLKKYVKKLSDIEEVFQN